VTSTGIVRRIDSVGRFVLPIELRRTLQIEDNDSLEIFVEDNTIVLKKYQPACIFCGNARDVSVYKGKNICADCIHSLQTGL
jgi:transcriptional pleiotropic regulator of transition state genes